MFYYTKSSLSPTGAKIKLYKHETKRKRGGEGFADTAAGTFPPRFTRTEKSFESSEKYAGTFLPSS